MYTIHYLNFMFCVEPDDNFVGTYKLSFGEKTFSALQHYEIEPFIIELVDAIPETMRKIALKKHYA